MAEDRERLIEIIELKSEEIKQLHDTTKDFEEQRKNMDADRERLIQIIELLELIELIEFNSINCSNYN